MLEKQRENYMERGRQKNNTCIHEKILKLASNFEDDKNTHTCVYVHHFIRL